ncbi:MAG TPA: hypothetical protein VHT73_06250 [Thermodesulfobacteriota bacterium]|nr:hypothetical protein [Thermodesulfobacteriota bacterium]
MSVYPRTITGKDGKKSEYWYVEVKGPNGKIKRSVGKKGLVTKAEARRIEQEMKRQIRLGQWGMVQTEPTFDTFAPEFVGYLKDVKQNRRWKQAEESIKNFAKVFGSKKLSEISSADIEDYKRLKSHEGKKPATINRILAFTGHLFNYAKRCNKFFGNNPVSISGLLPVNNQKVRVLSIKEETLLLANAKEPLAEPIGVILGCDPQLFVSWFDELLPNSSTWHELHFFDKYKITVNLCYGEEEETPQHLKQASAEAMDCLIETLKASSRVREGVGKNSNSRFNGKAYDELWRKEEETIKGRLAALARHRGDVN